jgi:predicted 3-demethylubiquinone-9 3-methyltransferase (glyoxalase superfamily)
MNAGPEFKFTEAISNMVDCEDQAEVDRYWSALTAEGGEESMCGWLKDRWGLSWQIVPKVMNQLLGDPDPGRAGRAMQAMLSMQKLDIAVLQAAADGRS